MAKGTRFGSVVETAGGTYRARYQHASRKYGKSGFKSRKAAENYLERVRLNIADGTWTPEAAATVTPASEPRGVGPTLKEVAETWLAGRISGAIGTRPLKERTAEEYRRLLDGRILPKLGSKPISTLTPDDVLKWHSSQGGVRGKRKGKPTPTTTAHAYDLLRSILKDAVRRYPHHMRANPCQLEGAGQAKTQHAAEPATLAQVAIMEATIRADLRAMITLGTWCALRYGEIAALRRRDIDLDAGTVRVAKGVVRLTGQPLIDTTPKSEAGKRTISIPPNALPAVREHIERFVGADPHSLLFPAKGGGYLAQTTFRRHWLRACEAAGRGELHFHDLRHTGATFAGRAGASLSELQYRLGHSTVSAAMRYQHTDLVRDTALAQRMAAAIDGELAS